VPAEARVDPWHSPGYPVTLTTLSANARREAWPRSSAEALEDRIVVKPGEEEQTTVSGIVIPTPPGEAQEGKVVAVGRAGTTRTATSASARHRGRDTVIYSKYGGTEVKVEARTT